MSPQPLDLHDVLSHLDKTKVDANTISFCQQTLDLLNTDKQQAANRAEAALRDATSRHDRRAQAYAHAYMAAALASQENFVEAVPQAESCHRLFKQLGSQQNMAIAQALLAVIYQMHLDKLSRALINPLSTGQTDLADMRGKALKRGDVQRASEYEAQFIQLGEQIRRARWIPAIPHLLPLVWAPVIDPLPSAVPMSSSDIQGYMEPVLFLYKTKRQVTQEAGRPDPGTIVDTLYTVHPVPTPNDPDGASSPPPRLDPNATYVAIKIDPKSAGERGYKPDDYLLVRNLDLSDIADLQRRAGADAIGWSFEVGSDGKVRFIGVMPPKFVGEPNIKIFNAQIDAILRRVP